MHFYYGSRWVRLFCIFVVYNRTYVLVKVNFGFLRRGNSGDVAGRSHVRELINMGGERVSLGVNMAKVMPKRPGGEA